MGQNNETVAGASLGPYSFTNDKTIPWFLTLGNHDDEGDMDTLATAQLDQQFPLSRTSSSPPSASHVTNYFFEVLANENDDEDARPALSL